MDSKLFNLNIERAVLGSVIFDPNLYEEVAAVLEAKDFYHPFHREVFEAMKELDESQEPIDEEFLKKKLTQKGVYDEEKFFEILSVQPLLNLGPYLKELKEKSIKRELFHLSTQINKLTVEEDLPADEALNKVQSQLYKISTKSATKDFKNAKEVVKSTLNLIKEMKRKGNSILTGLDTGFEQLNIKTAGFNPGDLIIIAARPSMGKTAFSLNLAQAVLDNNKGVAIFSLEMPAEQLLLRMISAKASLPLQRLKVGNLNDIEWSHLSKVSSELENKSLFIDDEGNINVHQLRAKLRKLKSSHPEIELAIIDYLQLMNGSSKKERHLEISEISRSLKLLARELQIPIIALSQLNRSLESRTDKRPLLSDLRESGAIEQDADVILFVYREDVYKIKEAKEKAEQNRKKGLVKEEPIKEKPVEEAEIIIGKQRNGPTGVVKLYFHKEFVKFAEYSTHISREFEAKETNFDIDADDNISVSQV